MREIRQSDVFHSQVIKEYYDLNRLDYDLNILQSYINMKNVLFLQEQAQSICKVLSASFDCALTSEKS